MLFCVLLHGKSLDCVLVNHGKAAKRFNAALKVAVEIHFGT